MAIEVEKKYRLPHERREAVISALEAAGAIFEGEDVEENVIFGGGRLDEDSAVLRIRTTDANNTLTYKRRIDDGSAAKRHVEHELSFDDAHEMFEIVEKLGFRRRLVYEKRRLTWRMPGAEVVIDALPFGDFMEIEGDDAAIAATEETLGIKDLEHEPRTYPSLTAEYGTKTGSIIEARFADLSGS